MQGDASERYGYFRERKRVIAKMELNFYQGLKKQKIVPVINVNDPE